MANFLVSHVKIARDKWWIGLVWMCTYLACRNRNSTGKALHPAALVLVCVHRCELDKLKICGSLFCILLLNFITKDKILINANNSYGSTCYNALQLHLLTQCGRKNSCKILQKFIMWDGSLNLYLHMLLFVE